MQHMMEILQTWGIPAAIMGMLTWWLKKKFDDIEAGQKEREATIEKLIAMTIRNSRATHVLAEATARAVQRIPDAHCNGDMESALQKAADIQNEEEDFVISQGIKHIIKH